MTLKILHSHHPTATTVTVDFAMTFCEKMKTTMTLDLFSAIEKVWDPETEQLRRHRYGQGYPPDNSGVAGRKEAKHLRCRPESQRKEGLLA